jgi:apolipoprotein N-acyltransferase
MKKIEITIAILSVIALVMNVLYIPGSNILAFVILMTYAMLYYPFGFLTLSNVRFRDIFKKSTYQGISPLRIMGTIFLGMPLSQLISGILFKFMFLPGAEIMLIVGLCCLLVTAVVAIVKYVKTCSQFYIEIFKRIAIIGGVGLFSFFLPTSMLKDIKYRNHPERVEKLRNDYIELKMKLEEEQEKNE